MYSRNWCSCLREAQGYGYQGGGEDFLEVCVPVSCPNIAPGCCFCICWSPPCLHLSQFRLAAFATADLFSIDESWTFRMEPSPFGTCLNLICPHCVLVVHYCTRLGHTFKFNLFCAFSHLARICQSLPSVRSLQCIPLAFVIVDLGRHMHFLGLIAWSMVYHCDQHEPCLHLL